MGRSRHLTVGAAEKAKRYERLYPGALSDDAQKAERMERIDLKERKQEGGRGTRYVTVPDLPWKKEPQ